MIVQKNPLNDTVLRLTYDTASCDGNPAHHLVYGFGTQLPSSPGQAFAVQGSACNPVTSPYNWIGVPDPSVDASGLLWFLMLANDEDGTEGSWGTDSSGVERVGPGFGGLSNECAMIVKDVANICGQ